RRGWRPRSRSRWTRRTTVRPPRPQGGIVAETPAPRPPGGGLRSRMSGGVRDGLVLQVGEEPFGAQLASQPAVLVAPEGGVRVEGVHVDAAAAGADPAGDLHAVGRVGRPDRAAEAVVAVVGDPDGVVLVLVGDEDEDRPEDLLAGDAHVVGDVAEHRRRDVPAAVVRPVQPAGDQLGALVLADADVVLHALLLPLRHQGADLGAVVGRVADGEPADHRGEGVGDLVVAAAGREDAGLRGARLAV